MSKPLHTVAETKAFRKRCEDILTPDEHARLIKELASDPMVGDSVSGTGGFRKYRFALDGKGKSGSVRVWFFPGTNTRPIYALFVYKKGERDNLNPTQKAKLRHKALQLKG